MSLVIYIMAFLVILGIVGTITVFFSNNTKDISFETSSSSEYNKFNLYMLDQTKNGNKVTKPTKNDKTNKYIQFSNGNTFVKIDNILYFNKIKLCENVNEFKFSVETATNGKDVLKTYIDINGTVYTTDYVIENISYKYRYIRMTITKLRGIPLHNAIQLSDIRIYDSNRQLYSYPKEATVIASLSNTYDAEPPNNLIDNNPQTKYCSTNWGNSQLGKCTITIDLGQNNGISLIDYPYYAYYTANDAPNRDPITWKMSVSNDGNNFKTIDYRKDMTITSSRCAQCTEGYFSWGK